MYETTTTQWTLTERGRAALVADVRKAHPDGVAGWKPSLDHTGSIEWSLGGGGIGGCVFATPGWEGHNDIGIAIHAYGGLAAPNAEAEWVGQTIPNDGEVLTAEHYVKLLRPMLTTLAMLFDAAPPAPAPKVSAEFLAALDRMIDFAHGVFDAWPRATDGDSLDVGRYPAYLPSFDEHVSDLMAWRESLRSKS